MHLGNFKRETNNEIFNIKQALTKIESYKE